MRKFTLARYGFYPSIVQVDSEQGLFRPLLLRIVPASEEDTKHIVFIRTEAWYELYGKLPVEVRYVLEDEFATLRVFGKHFISALTLFAELQGDPYAPVGE